MHVIAVVCNWCMNDDLKQNRVHLAPPNLFPRNSKKFSSNVQPSWTYRSSFFMSITVNPLKTKTKKKKQPLNITPKVIFVSRCLTDIHKHIKNTSQRPDMFKRFLKKKIIGDWKKSTGNTTPSLSILNMHRMIYTAYDKSFFSSKTSIPPNVVIPTTHEWRAHSL